MLVALGESEKSLTEISNEVGLSKATVYRILNSLQKKDFVARDSHTGKYFLHWGLLGLASASIYRSHGLVQCAYPAMERLWRLTSETITLYVRRGTSRLCVAELPSPHPLRFTAGVGVTVPLHAGSPGKLLMAYMPQQELEEVIKHIELAALTQKTITDRENLLEELKQIRERGWATSFGERIDGGSSLSVPIWNNRREVVASLNILAPYSRVGEEKIMSYLPALKECAREISSRLGGTDSEEEM